MEKSMIKKFATGCALTLTLVTSAVSQAASIWEVKKGDDTVYVGGTVHMLPASEFPLPKPFMEVYGKTDSIVLEAKLPEPTDQQGQMAILQAMSFGPGETLSSKLSEETLAQLKAHFTTLGINIAELDRFKPGFIISMMTVMEAQRLQMGGDGVDAFFAKQAKSDGKSAEYLESLEFQLNMMAQMGAGEEDQLIKTSLAYMPEFEPLLKKLVSAWRTGDEKTLVELVINRMKEESPKGFKAILTDRNQDWVPKIEQMFGDDDKEFVLVGVGHLVGEGSVIELLEAKGYQVTKL